MGSLFGYLEKVRARPGMYVGVDEQHRMEQLRQLETLIHGYCAAVDEHGIRDDGARAFASLPRYVRERYGWSTSCGIIAAIRDACDSDEEAWDRFWDLVDELRGRGEEAG